MYVLLQVEMSDKAVNAMIDKSYRSFPIQA